MNVALPSPAPVPALDGLAGVVAAADLAPLAVVGWVVLVVAAVAGLGCLAAVLGVLFPRVASACDATSRATSPTAPLLVGSLVVLGTAAVLAGLSRLGPVAAGLALLVVGLPTILALVAGGTATLPLLGERVLGAKGPDASPLRRGVTGALTLGFATLPALVLRAPVLALLVATAVVGWPVGVGLSAALAARKARTRRAGAPRPEDVAGTP